MRKQRKRTQLQKYPKIGPTPERLAKIMALIPPDADMALSATTLGVLRANEVITNDMYHAGEAYGRLCSAVWGGIAPQGTLGKIDGSFTGTLRTLNVAADIAIYNKWRDSRDVLLGLSGNVYAHVMDACFYGCIPARKLVDSGEIGAIRTGLCGLVASNL